MYWTDLSSSGVVQRAYLQCKGSYIISCLITHSTKYSPPQCFCLFHWLIRGALSSKALVGKNRQMRCCFFCFSKEIQNNNGFNNLLVFFFFFNPGQMVQVLTQKLYNHQGPWLYLSFTVLSSNCCFHLRVQGGFSSSNGHLRLCSRQQER